MKTTGDFRPQNVGINVNFGDKYTNKLKQEH